MTFGEAIRTCFRKYATFSGRAPRSEYWWFVLFGFLGGAAAGLLDGFANGITGTRDGPTIVSNVFNLAVLIPSLAVGWRRMHDTGRSGLYLFYPLLAMIGVTTFAGVVAGFQPLLEGDLGALLAGGTAIIMVVAFAVVLVSPLIVLWWLTRPSNPGPNQYGPNPLEVTP